MTNNDMLRLRLVASQTAAPETVRLDHVVDDAINDLARISYHIVVSDKPPSEYTRHRIRAVACRLLEGCGPC